jgi:hypothetical protein
VVDGKPLAGHVVPVFDDGKIHQVEVTLGAAEIRADKSSSSHAPVPVPVPVPAPDGP